MTISSSSYEYLTDLIHRRSGMVLHDDKEYLVEARLVPLARSTGAGDIQALVSQLRRGPDPALETSVVEAMAIHETSFFRDRPMFDALRSSVLPYLIKSRSHLRRLNIWSAACAKGQEPYSLAMLLREDFPELEQWSTRLVASDFSSKILELAAAGCYGQHEVDRGLPARLLTRYFGRQGLDWRIKDEITRMIQFEQISLHEPFPQTLPQMDLVLLCNVMIYFDNATKRRVLDRVHRVLAPDGLLILGGVESMFRLHDGFKRVALGDFHTCFQRTDAPGGPNART